MKSKWYDKKFIVIALLFLFFPVGLYGLWKGSIFNRNTKVGLTILFILLIVTVNFNNNDKIFLNTSSDAQTAQPHKPMDKVLAVSDFKYTIDNQAAVSIIVCIDKENFADITLLRSNIKEGYIINSKSRDMNEFISATATYNGAMYDQSEKHDTSLNLTIQSIDQRSKKAVITYSGKFIDTKSLSKYLYIPPTTVTITGKNFDNLTMQI